MAQKAAAAGRAAAGRSALVPPDDATDSSTSEPFYDAQDSSTSPPFYETGMLGNGQNYDQQPRHGQDPHYDQQPLDGQEPHYGQDLDRIDHEAVTMGHMGSDSHVEHMRHSTRGTGHADGESRMIHSLDNPPPRPEPDADGKFDPVAYKAYEDYVVNAERLVATAERTYETSKLNAEGKVAEEPKEQKVPLYLKNMGDEVAEKEEESGLMCFIFIAIICSVACFVLANPGDDRPKEPAAGQEVRQDVQGIQEVANSSDSQGPDQDRGPQDLGGEDRGPQDPGGEDDGAEVLQGEQDPGGEQGDAVDQGQGEEGLEEL